MKSRLVLLFLFCSVASYGQNGVDSLKNVNIEQVEVYSYKTIGTLRNSPVAASVFSNGVITRDGIDAPDKLTAITPNLYMPGYGSKLTSAVYIRGIGSRMNDPAIGMYVDNIPYLDKSMYDLDFYDLSRIEVLRGPQGSLYGRNTMGGIINVYTPSPLNYQGVRALLSYGSGNTLHSNATGYFKTGENTGLALGASYRHTDGFFENEYDGSSADELTSVAARARFDWRINKRWLMNFSLSGEKSWQAGYPYGVVDENGDVQPVNYNDDSHYRRQWIVGSAYWEHTGRGYSLSGTTSYQYFDDDMRMDQDYTADNIFTLGQKQHQNALTQEVVAKSRNDNRYQWIAGVFGFGKWLDTDAPVTLKKDFFTDLFAGINFPPNASVGVTDDCNTTGVFDTPSYGMAVFHQSTLRNFPFSGFSLSAGLRLDYEKVSIDYNAAASLSLRAVMPPTYNPQEYEVGVYIDSMDNRSYTQLSPKFTLDYQFPAGGRIYACISRGYRTGGYNIQLFSDLLRTPLEALSKSSRAAQTKLIEMDPSTIYYKPEYSWNYEVGAKTDFLDSRLQTDLAVFYIDTRNQQVTQFMPSGLGRVMKNAAHSRSYGAEISAKGYFGRYSASLSYGYTNAKFIEYSDSVKVDGVLKKIDYSGNYVPFVPRNTLSASIDREFIFRDAWIEGMTLGMQYQAIGKLYFTESNNESQDIYGLLNASATFKKGGYAFVVWGRNITDSSYKLFAFHNNINGKTFAQAGNPRQIGVTLRMNF